MTYISNSLTSSNPAADLYTAMATALSAAGFTLVDTQVISTRTHKVWKSAAASNSMSLDWYLDVAYTTTGSGSVWLGAFENYSSPNGFRGPYNGTNATPDETTYYTLNGATGSALETNWTHISNNVAQIQTTSTAFAYWISITTDRVIAMSSVASTALVYCGFFDMYTPWANKIGALAFPLVTTTVNAPSANNTTSHSSQCAVNRRPPVSAGFTRASHSCLAAWNAGSTGTIGGQGAGAPVGAVDTGVTPYLEGPRGGRLQVALSWSFNSSDGALVTVGYLKDLAVFAGSATTRGDTCTISSATWVLSGLSGGRCYGFKAA